MAENKSSKCLEWDQVFDPAGLPAHDHQAVAGPPKQIDPVNDFQSATAEIPVNGCLVRFTVRACTVAEVVKRVNFLTHYYKRVPEEHRETPDPGKPVPHGSAVTEEPVPYCEVHQRYFERKQRGKHRWFSHKTETGYWCNYRRPVDDR